METPTKREVGIVESLAWPCHIQSYQAGRYMSIMQGGADDGV